MQKEVMTVHKALAELKLIDEKIIQAVSEGVYCAANKHSNEKIGGIILENYIDTVMRGRYDKVIDYIKRQKALKKAVSLSNAVTKVTIAGTEYTVAEAIWMKNHGVESDRMLVNEMRRQYDKAQAKINKENEGLDVRADQYVTGLYGQKEGKTNADEIERMKSSFISANQYELIDPIDILGKIDSMEKRIDDFLAEVDSELSISNSLTKIEIEY